MTKAKELHQRWLKEPEYKIEYERLVDVEIRRDKSELSSRPTRTKSGESRDDSRK